MFKNNRGITLIVLMVTVTVMIILLTVSVVFVIDKDNGIIGDTVNAKKQVENKMNEQNQWTQNIIEEFE